MPHALEVEGRQVPITNPDKALYPSGFTKAQVIDYYIRVSGYLLPHLAGRPITLKRFPDGVAGRSFYAKDAPAYTPPWIRIAPVPRRRGGPDIRYIVVDGLPSLVWCANAAGLEIHPFLHRAPAIERPDSIVFDLDPGEGADLLTCARVAFLLKRKLQSAGLESFPKVSGAKGIQVYVPLNTPVTYAETRPFAKRMAEELERESPGLVVSAMAKAVRHAKVLVDWSQNADFKTTIGVYSLRARRDRPYVSMPVDWKELRAAMKRQNADSLCLEPEAALERLRKLGDLFAPVLSLKQKLPASLVT